MFELDGYIYKFRRVYNKRGQKVDTMCGIFAQNSIGLKFITSGLSRLNPKDKFNKKIGKILALKDALDSLEVGRAINKKVFAKFEEEYSKGKL